MISLYPRSKCLSWFVWILTGSCATWAADAPLRVGVARIDITPADPVTMAGYESRKELSEGIHDRLSARAVAFEENKHRLVLVSTDVLGFYNGTADAFRQAILSECQLDPGELFLAAIH